MLNPDVREILLCLKGEEVEFIVVGAYALAAHGFPRATGDIDVWVRNTPANAKKILRALETFGQTEIRIKAILLGLGRIKAVSA